MSKIRIFNLAENEFQTTKFPAGSVATLFLKCTDHEFIEFLNNLGMFI